MKTLLADDVGLERLLHDRRRSGLDLYDEVWDGKYVIMSLPGNEHQDIVNDIAADLTVLVKRPGLGRVQPGANVSDDPEDWTRNYRCPDVVVYLAGNPAEDRGSHWLGGPDVAVEILSDGDLTEEKLPFYAAVGVRELFVLDRDPWVLSLRRLTGGTAGETLEVAGETTPGGVPLRSEVLDLDWALTAADPPTVTVAGR